MYDLIVYFYCCIVIRILVVFKDGLATLWDIQESRAILSIAQNSLQLSKETKEVTSACWACPLGSKVVFGYSTGELSLWDIPTTSSEGRKVISQQDIYPVQTAPICKLNLGYKVEKNPIASLKWSCGEGKNSKLYIIGASDASSSSPPQVFGYCLLALFKLSTLLYFRYICMHGVAIDAYNEVCVLKLLLHLYSIDSCSCVAGVAIE